MYVFGFTQRYSDVSADNDHNNNVVSKSAGTIRIQQLHQGLVYVRDTNSKFDDETNALLACYSNEPDEKRSGIKIPERQIPQCHSILSCGRNNNMRIAYNTADTRANTKTSWTNETKKIYLKL